MESLDDDRILRRFVSTILATLRTNFYAVDGTSAGELWPDASPAALAFQADRTKEIGIRASVGRRGKNER